MTDLSKLTAAELDTLAKEASAMADKRREEEKEKVRKDVFELIKAAGYSFDELFQPAAVKEMSKKKIPAKYMDPSNPENTWSGRGRQPVWLKEALDAGRTLEDFAI